MNRIASLPTIYLTISFFIGCSSSNSDKPGERYLSNSIRCETDQICFDEVESRLLAKEIGKFDLDGFNWSELSKADTIINFHEYVGELDSATIVILDNVEIEQEGDYLIRLGSDDGFRIFVNGEEIASRIIGRALVLDSDWIPVHFRTGINQLIIQVNQGLGDWKLHYRIDREANLAALIEDQLIEIYRDLPDLNIVEDTSKVLVQNRDLRQNLDTLHTISYSWLNSITGNEKPVGTFQANEAPLKVPFPQNVRFPILFKYSVEGRNGQELFSETIPIFSKASLIKYVKEAYQSLIPNPKHQQWIEGLEFVFPELLEKDQIHTYSTRIKTEFLWDVMNKAGYSLTDIGGPRTKEVKGLISKVYRPDMYTQNTVKVLGINPQPENEEDLTHYFDSYHGHTHNTLMLRSSYARYFDVELTFPFIRQSIEENNLESVINYYVSGLADSTTFNIIAWSNSVPLLLEVLERYSLPIDNVAILGSFLGDDPTDRFRTIQKIRQKNPQIKWYIWHGEEDERVPISVMENWIEEFRSQGYQVFYERLPLTDHEVYFVDVKKRFYSVISNDNN